MFQVDLMERMIGAGEALVETMDSGASRGVVSVPDTLAWLPLANPTQVRTRAVLVLLSEELNE